MSAQTQFRTIVSFSTLFWKLTTSRTLRRMINCIRCLTRTGDTVRQLLTQKSLIKQALPDPTSVKPLLRRSASRPPTAMGLQSIRRLEAQSNTLLLFIRVSALIGLMLLPVTTFANDAIHAALKRLQPTTSEIQISPSPMQGISQVTIGLQVLYVSNDGAFALGGPLIDMANGSNLTEQSLSSARQHLLEINEATPFVYAAEDAKHSITVFTDIDCPHCRRLHNELPSLQAAGVDVHYIMLPRSGKGSASYLKTVSAACSKDPEASITAAMNGQQPTATTCDNPIDQHLALARTLNIASTPTIVLSDGSLSLGYRSAAALLKLINGSDNVSE